MVRQRTRQTVASAMLWCMHAKSNPHSSCCTVWNIDSPSIGIPLEYSKYNIDMSRFSEDKNDHGQLLWMALCLIVLFMAATLRISHLGDADYGLDEIFHVYVSQELLKGNPPVLPSGYHYERGLPYSWVVATARYVGGFNEVALRMPSVVFGLFVIVLVYWMTSRWFSPLAGIVAAFPDHIFSY